MAQQECGILSLQFHLACNARTICQKLNIFYIKNKNVYSEANIILYVLTTPL